MESRYVPSLWHMPFYSFVSTAILTAEYTARLQCKWVSSELSYLTSNANRSSGLASFVGSVSQCNTLLASRRGWEEKDVSELLLIMQCWSSAGTRHDGAADDDIRAITQTVLLNGHGHHVVDCAGCCYHCHGTANRKPSASCRGGI